MAKSTGKQGGRASRATPTAANRGTQVRPGDATGAENERLRKENAAAIQEAATRTTLINPPPRVESPDEVVDYTGGGNPNPGNAEQAPRISFDEALGDGQTEMTTYADGVTDDDIDSLPDGKSHMRAEPLPQPMEEPAPAHGQRRDSQQAPVQRVEAPRVEAAHKVLRVNTDLEDITIGKDNHYSFFVNEAYKVPAHVYDHLAEKGYVLR